MANLLQKALKTDEPMFTIGMRALEKSTGNSGVDTRLIADIHENAHKVMRTLGLDTTDTTGKELYHALIGAVRRSDIQQLLYDTDYVLYIIGDDVISFNLIDVIENAHHELHFESSIISHGQRSLRGEIIERYLCHIRTNETTTLEIVKSIGLLPESDAWYNNAKAYKKHTTGVEK
ncbi:MAG: hypothetical protein NTV39_02050 [Candidatus Saccharibacteria bacterium]|nr:hypothetical protein [Candidatus Saccharibacteria bacterium]